MLHRVLPSLKERRCFTIWLSGDGLRSIDTDAPSKGHGSLEWDLLLHPRYRKHIARLVYATSWADSIKESHLANEQTNKLLSEHWKNVYTIMDKFGSHMPAISQYLPFSNETIPEFTKEMVQWIP